LLVPLLNLPAKALNDRYDPGIEITLGHLSDAEDAILATNNDTVVSAAREMASLYSSVIDDRGVAVAGDTAGSGPGQGTKLPVTRQQGDSVYCAMAGENAYYVDYKGNVVIPPDMVETLLTEMGQGGQQTLVDDVTTTMQGITFNNFAPFCEFSPTGLPQFAITWPWESGISFAQIFVSVPGNTDIISRGSLATKLVQLASKNVVNPTDGGYLPPRNYYAQAQFFFTCDSNWDSCFDPAPWNFGWRARMRVFNPVQMAVVTGAKGNQDTSAMMSAAVADHQMVAARFKNAKLASDVQDLIANKHLTMALH